MEKDLMLTLVPPNANALQTTVGADAQQPLRFRSEETLQDALEAFDDHIGETIQRHVSNLMDELQAVFPGFDREAFESNAQFVLTELLVPDMPASL